uniref:Putative ovule protein n=1 Tax=Solanum chacoense TaxID=4108 RepID=A0A0V0GQZ7_SOLCH
MWSFKSFGVKHRMLELENLLNKERDTLFVTDQKGNYDTFIGTEEVAILVYAHVLLPLWKRLDFEFGLSG